jgi:hypothetical protein
MSVKTYDPKQGVLTVGGFPISGFADGTYIMATRQQDGFVSSAGADGEIARAKSNDKRTDLTITLMQTSLSNDVLSGIAQYDERTGKGVVPVAYKDLSGTTTIFSGSGWVRKLPDVERSKEISNVEWVMELADSDIFVGGTLV